MKTFAVADLHGRFDLLEKAVEQIEMSNHSGGKVVFLGDYVDRGPDAAKIITRLMAGPSDPSRWRWVCLQGNHEVIMLTALGAAGMMGWWMQNGGGATLISYGHPKSGAIDASVVPQEHRDWIAALPLFHTDDHRVYVHAATDRKIEDLSATPPDTLQWKLYDEDDPGGHFGKHVVHGHHQFRDGPKLHLGRTDLDTGAFYTGRLVVGVFDDDKAGGPVSTIDVIGSADDRWSDAA